jgi:hypothetical protein
VKQFQYLETTITYQNSIHEEIKSRLKSKNVCWHSAQNMSFTFSSKNIKITIQRTVIFLLFCIGVKLGLSHRGRNVAWSCFRIGWWGIFGPKRDEVTGKWRRLHNEEFSDLYSSPNIICVMKSKGIKWAERVACVGDMWGANRVSVRGTEKKRLLGRHRHRWEDNIKMVI